MPLAGMIFNLLTLDKRILHLLLQDLTLTLPLQGLTLLICIQGLLICIQGLTLRLQNFSLGLQRLALLGYGLRGMHSILHLLLRGQLQLLKGLNLRLLQVTLLWDNLPCCYVESPFATNISLAVTKVSLVGVKFVLFVARVLEQCPGNYQTESGCR